LSELVGIEGALAKIPTREEIERLQEEVLKLPQTLEPVTRHYFADGMYCREVFRKQGVLVVGKVHKKEHFFMVVQGTLAFWTEEGMKRESAPYIWVSKPGTKRVTLALEDTTVVTVHQVSSSDIDEIEKELVEDEPASAYGPGNVLKNPLLEIEP
jgi:quercetin dioxygenase-like cupin family protein